MKEGKVFGSSQIKPVGLRSYLTSWSKEIHFLKEPLQWLTGQWYMIGRFYSIVSFWSILLVVLILIDGRANSGEYLICFISESACHFATEKRRYVFSSHTVWGFWWELVISANSKLQEDLRGQLLKQSE